MENLLDENSELPMNFLSEIYKWALESVARVSLDTRLGCLDANLTKDSEPQKIIDAINIFFWNVAEVELKMPVWRIYKTKAFNTYIGALEDFRTLCMKHIMLTLNKMNANAVKNKKSVSIVERILLKTGNPKVAAVLALDLLLVGVDTTSVGVASTLYQLSKNPEKQKKLYEELQHLLPAPDSEIKSTVLEKMYYLKACIKETFRMYPVIIGNGRSLTSDAIIAGYSVPRGTHIIFPHLVVSNSKEYFEDPEKFIPERWLKTIPEITTSHTDCPFSQNRIHPYVSLPFGYGRRSCLGRRYAEIELQILLAKIFRKYMIEYNYGQLTYKISPTYVPEQPLKFRMIMRT